MILWTTGSSRLIQASSSANARVHSSRRTTKQSSRNREDDDATGKSKLEGVIRPVPGGRSKDEGATPRGPRVKKGNPRIGRFLDGARSGRCRSRPQQSNGEPVPGRGWGSTLSVRMGDS